MLTLPRILAFSLLLHPALIQAAEAWAPGVSREDGWYDYDKAGINDGPMADTAMCWAASSSNIISWWQNLNSEKLTGTVLPDEDPWTVFRTVYNNIGGTPTNAINWWINGLKTDANGSPIFSEEELDLSQEDKNKGNVFWFEGGFLKDVYDTSQHSVLIASNANGSNKNFAKNIVDAINSGYALSISVYNSGVAHSYTLWGVEYDSETYNISKAWITDSDDKVGTGDAPTLIEKNVACTQKGDTFSVHFDENFGAEWRYAAGLWTASIPEPSTFSLIAGIGVLALVASRRSRR